MIIESAFMKVVEVLNFHGNDHYLYESSISQLFSNSLILELNARNIDNPLNKILFEKRYNPELNRRCDIYTNFNFLDPSLSNYGIFNENFIEVKYFGNMYRNKGNQAKSENAASIIIDLYRLLRGVEGENKGLYSLVIFDEDPSNYLAFNRANGSRRNWLDSFFKPGINRISFNLEEEPKTIRDKFKEQTFNEDKLKIDMEIRVHNFAPLKGKSGYHGSLIQILRTF